MQLAMMVTVPLLRDYGQAAAVAAAAALVALVLSMAGAGARRTDLRTQAVAYPAFLLLSAGYWLPAMVSFYAVGMAMLRCPSLAQLPAALLSPAVLPHLLLFLWGCDRWTASVVLECLVVEMPENRLQELLGGLQPCIRNGSDWPFVACRGLLCTLLPPVRPSR